MCYISYVKHDGASWSQFPRVSLVYLLTQDTSAVVTFDFTFRKSTEVM